MRFNNLFKKRRHPNPAINDLYRHSGSIDKKIEKIVSDLPYLAEAVRQGGTSLLQKTLIDQIKEYDSRTGREISKNINEAKSEAMLEKLTGMMLLAFYEECATMFQDETMPSYLTTALHYELYQSLPSDQGFVAYLTYQNPHFENPNMAPAHKFGNDIAEIVSVSDQLFYFIIAQQAAVISDVTKKLIRWVLFDEPMEAPS
ncbi:hypothetical protein JYT92_00245 [bacterium AH-315-L15]|nr:hypothetical protein [bacterium AH-315-L15]